MQRAPLDRSSDARGAALHAALESTARREPTFVDSFSRTGSAIEATAKTQRADGDSGEPPVRSCRDRPVLGPYTWPVADRSLPAIPIWPRTTLAMPLGCRGRSSDDVLHVGHVAPGSRGGLVRGVPALARVHVRRIPVPPVVRRGDRLESMALVLTEPSDPAVDVEEVARLAA